MFQDKNLRTLRVLLAVSLLVCVFGPSAQAVTFFQATDGSYYDYADIVNEPSSMIWWDQATITYKLDATFTAFWGDTVSQASIRDVFNQWGTAANRDYGTVNSHYAAGSGGAIWDLGTIALHELGHGVGLGHPFDEAGPPQTPGNFGGAHFDLNYQFTDWDIGTPYDGTQTWAPGAETELEVMGYGPGSAGLALGALNRKLSWDELNGARYVYGYGPGSTSGLNFVEVGPGDVADITVRAEDLGAGGPLAGMPSTWAQNTDGDPTDGGVIQSSEMIFNSALAAEIGYVAGLWTGQWDLRLPGWSGLYPYGIQVSAELAGATLLSQTSGTMGDHHLQDFEADETGAPAVYTWTHPSNNHPLVGPTIIGMEFDAPVSAPTAFTTDAEGNPLLDLSSSAVAEFIHTGLPDDDIGPWLKPSGTYAVIPEVLEEGIVLRGSENAPSEVTRIGLLNVSGMGLGLGDLNDDLLELEGIDYLCLPCMGDDILLGADGVEHVLLFTDGSNITAEMIADPDFEFYHVPDGEDYVAEDFLAYGEMVVILESEALFDGYLLTHRSYSLLGRTVTGIIPEPVSLALLFTAGLGLMGYRSRRCRG